MANSPKQRYGWRAPFVHLAAATAGLMAAPTIAASRAPLVWAFGDSLTAGYGLPPAQGFVPRLQAALRQAGVEATVRNGGVSGDTAAQARARLKWGLRGLGAKPDLVIVELGANDMLRGLPVGQARGNLDGILAEFAARGIPVLLAGMRAAPNLGSEYGRAFDAMYPSLARARRTALYPFFLAGVAGRRDLIQADGLHPNARGVDVIVSRIAPVVAQALRRSEPAD